MIKKKQSIYTQYVQVMIIIPALILVINVIVGYINYKLARKDKLLVYLNAAAIINSRIEHGFDYIEKFSEIVGKKILSKKNRSPRAIGEILQKTYSVAQIGRDVMGLTSFDFVTPNGKVVANAREGAVSYDIFVKKYDRDWMVLAPLQPWKLHVSLNLVDGIGGKYTVGVRGIPAGFGISDKDGKFLGIISSGISVEQLSSKINKALLNERNVQFMIITSDYKFIVSSDQKNNNTTNLNKLKTLIETSHQGFLKENFIHNDVQYLVYQYVKNYPFIILVGANTYLEYKDFRDKVLPQIILSLTIGILLYILFLFFRNKLLIPIKELSDIARSISCGKIDITIPQYNSDEISNLADHIQKIKDYTYEIHDIKSRLENTTNILEKSNNILEQKVNERTYNLEQALSAKTTFFNNISHEIRTPIQGFTNISEGLVEHWSHFNDQKKLELAKQVASNAKRLALLIGGLLDLSKFAAGKTSLDLRKTNLNLIVKSIIDECETLYMDRKQIKIKFLEYKSFEIIADREKIAQVLRNLFVNAIKFSHDHSIISVSIAASEIIYDDNNTVQGLHFAIADQGVGVPENELESIFTAFTQSTKTKSVTGGTGLGLAICYEIIELHHGKIWAENNIQGTTFHFVIPIAQTKHIDGRKIIKRYDIKLVNKIARGKPGTILIIDDEEACLVSMELLLYGTNYKLIKANTGRKGLESLHVNHKKIDIILLDLMMPDMYGLNVLVEIKKDPRLAKIPVILQTGTADQSEIEKAYKIGIVCHIAKPYQKQSIIDELDKAMN